MVVFCKKYILLKEKKSEYDKEYQKINKNKISKIKSEYRNNNKNNLINYNKNYDKLNKEKISERKRLYYLNNKERIIKNSEKYRKENPKIKTNKKGTGNYNITLAERNKEEWLKTEIILYKFKMSEDDGKIFYKYGLTKNIKNRLYHIPYKVEILETFTLDKYTAVYKEKELLTNITSYTPNIKFGGYTECFI